MVNRKNTLVIMGCWLFVITAAGCAGMFHRTFKDETSRSELKEMGFSLDRYEEREVVLTPDDKTKIEASLDRPLKYYPKGLAYYGEIKRHYGEIGDIVPLRLKTPYGRLVMLVRIRWDAIDKIMVAENVAKEKQLIVSNGFLSQFLGKTAGSSYKVTEAPQDSPGVQEGVRPIAGEPDMSREIADRLQEVMAIHAVDRF